MPQSTYKAISLGWGVQSWTLAAMVALGELPPVDVAIHADTGHEMKSTYAFAAQWTPWLVAHGVNVVTVRDPLGGGVVVQNSQSLTVEIPAYTVIGGKDGRIRRQCTHQWKTAPVRRFLQEERHGQPVDLFLGISTDEWQRMKAADVDYIRHVYQLIDLGMNRRDCLDWLSTHDLPSPGKSSCTFCPFHNLSAWRAMKRAGGADWEEALAVDVAIRDTMLPGALYVHPKRVPLADAVVIPEDFGYTQLALLASNDDDAECDSGFCFL